MSCDGTLSIAVFLLSTVTLGLNTIGPVSASPLSPRITTLSHSSTSRLSWPHLAMIPWPPIPRKFHASERDIYNPGSAEHQLPGESSSPVWASVERFYSRPRDIFITQGAQNTNYPGSPAHQKFHASERDIYNPEGAEHQLPRESSSLVWTSAKRFYSRPVLIAELNLLTRKFHASERDIYNPEGAEHQLPRESSSLGEQNTNYLRSPAHYKDGKILMWDTTEHKCLTMMDNNESVESLAINPTKNFMSSTCGPAIKLWDLDHKTLVDEIRPEVTASRSLQPDFISQAWSTDGTTLYAGYTDVDRPRPVRTPATVSKVKRLATTENPPSQRQLSRMCGTSLKTINNIIHKDLELDTRRKGKVHKLTPFHMKNRATNARKLYEEHLAGSRSEYTATLDEAWMYVTYCNGIRKICYIKRGNQVPDNWVHQCSETFPKGFMVVGVMTGRGVLPLIKVPSKVKVNSEFYIECVLKPVIEQLKDLYPGEMDKVFLHHDKASSHTSNKTQQFLQEMKDTLGLNFIRNSDIPVKSPDASPLDFYGFGMLKQRLFNRRPKTEAGLWKAAQEEWSNVSLSKVKEVFAAWKVRCREIAKKKGKHIEHMKKIHVRKIKF
ncbi:GNB2L1 [Cordylochernes scorpioides]|uniref:GNB2L1 n=1 Tax=Cordylochernes scorpioides TaxID=51811 RepID=A0ABY6JYH3_9ARAC|nr:GNB2L1 [Cordylochernes scorpioides]